MKRLLFRMLMWVVLLSLFLTTGVYAGESYQYDLKGYDTFKQFVSYLSYVPVKGKTAVAFRKLNDMWVYDEPFMTQEVLDNFLSIKPVEWKILPTNVAKLYTNYWQYREKYSEVVVYYTGFDVKVKDPNWYFINGPMYFLVVLVKDKDNHFKVAEFSTAPSEFLLKRGYGFGSNTEKVFAHFLEKRESEGIYEFTKNYKNRPTYIIVRLTKSVNYHYYGCSSPCTKNVDFYYYVKNVLPNEWIVGSWDMDSIKAGAMAVKMYGWYYHYHPKWSIYGADVVDDDRDQMFIVQTEHWRSNMAINSIYNIAIFRQFSGLFPTYYRAGTYSGSGKWSGVMYQWGSKYLADRGYNWREILNYYYSFPDDPIVFRSY